MIGPDGSWLIAGWTLGLLTATAGPRLLRYITDPADHERCSTCGQPLPDHNPAHDDPPLPH